MQMSGLKIRPIVAASMAISAVIVAQRSDAQETTTYTYDELGRLVETDTAGGPNDAVETSLDYDDAGNRTSYEVTGSSNPASNPRYLLIPVTGGRMVVVIE